MLHKIYNAEPVTLIIEIPRRDMDSSSKNSLPVFFFLSELSPLAELWPF